MIKLLILFFLYTSTTLAQVPSPPPGTPKPPTPEQLRLFAEIMSLRDILSSPSEAKKSFEVHLLDSYEHFPSLRSIAANNLKSINGTQKMYGTMKYVKAFPMPYFYDVINENQNYIHEVRIYFIGANRNDKSLFDQLLSEAEQIWNSSRISRDFNYEFRFKRVDDIRKAHYFPAVRDKTRGPYNVAWSREWTGPVVAHELGHMLGIADEYETLTSDQLCLKNSLMCSSWQGQLMKHHHYFILRRLVVVP